MSLKKICFVKVNFINFHRFASRATCVKNKPHVNEVLTDNALLKRYSRQIAKLQSELQVCTQETYDKSLEQPYTMWKLSL